MGMMGIMMAAVIRVFIVISFAAGVGVVATAKRKQHLMDEEQAEIRKFKREH